MNFPFAADTAHEGSSLRPSGGWPKPLRVWSTSDRIVGDDDARRPRVHGPVQPVVRGRYHLARVDRSALMDSWIWFIPLLPEDTRLWLISVLPCSLGGRCR